MSSETEDEVQTSKSIATEGDESFQQAAEQGSDERVSVKQHVTKKLEPGEEDRALCDVNNKQ